MKMTGNTIFITGGGTGIGRGLATSFHALGNKVIIAGRRRAPLQETCDSNPGMQFRQIDVRDPESIKSVADWLAKHHPDLNVLINNAGVVFGDGTGGAIDDSRAVATVDTNLLGPIRMTSALIEHLKTKPYSVVVNVTSGLAFTPLVSSAIYSATKAGLHSWTLSLRFRLRGTSVRVLELAPPWVRTEAAGGFGNPRAVDLDDFIAAAMEQFATGADELVVGRARELRDNAGPNERDLFERYNGGGAG